LKTWSCVTCRREGSNPQPHSVLLTAGMEREHGNIEGAKVSKLSSPHSHSCIEEYRYTHGYKYIHVYRLIHAYRSIHAYRYMHTYSCIQGWTGGYLPMRAAWLLLSMARLRSTLQAQQAWVKAHPAPGWGASTPSSFSHHHPCFNNSMVNAM